MPTFSKMPLQAFADARLSARDLRVLGILYAHDDGGGIVYPSRATIAAMTSMHERKVSAATTNLQALGWIEKVGGGHRGRATEWRLRVPPACTHSHEKGAPKRGERVPPNGKKGCLQTVKKGAGRGQPEVSSEVSIEGSIEVPPNPRENEIAEVFEYWQLRLEHPESRLDGKRRKAINRALQLGYTVDQLCAAINGCARSPFHMGDNARGERFDALGLILRDADHIDRFISNSSNPPATMNSTDRRTAANLAAIDSWLAEDGDTEVNSGSIYEGSFTYDQEE